MNWWSGAAVTLGLVTVALYTLPYGLVLLAALYWVWKRS